MWIKRIKLKNFKSYAEAEFEFPAPEQGRNLVLIGAENGHGKTTLLEAITFAYTATTPSNISSAQVWTAANSKPMISSSAPCIRKPAAKLPVHTKWCWKWI